MCTSLGYLFTHFYWFITCVHLCACTHHVGGHKCPWSCPRTTFGIFFLQFHTGSAHQTPSTRLVLQATLLPEPLLPCCRLAPLSSWNHRLAVLERFPLTLCYQPPPAFQMRELCLLHMPRCHFLQLSVYSSRGAAALYWLLLPSLRVQRQLSLPCRQKHMTLTATHCWMAFLLN